MLASILQGKILTSEAVSLYRLLGSIASWRVASVVTSSQTVPVVQIGQEQAATSTFDDIKNFESNRKLDTLTAASA